MTSTNAANFATLLAAAFSRDLVVLIVLIGDMRRTSAITRGLLRSSTRTNLSMSRGCSPVHLA